MSDTEQRISPLEGLYIEGNSRLARSDPYAIIRQQLLAARAQAVATAASIEAALATLPPPAPAPQPRRTPPVLGGDDEEESA